MSAYQAQQTLAVLRDIKRRDEMCRDGIVAWAMKIVAQDNRIVRTGKPLQRIGGIGKIGATEILAVCGWYLMEAE